MATIRLYAVEAAKLALCVLLTVLVVLCWHAGLPLLGVR